MGMILTGIVEGLGRPLEAGEEETLTTHFFRKLATHYHTKGQTAALVKECLDDFAHDFRIPELLGNPERWTEAEFEKIGVPHTSASDLPAEDGVYFGVIRADKSRKASPQGKKMDGYGGSTIKFKRRLGKEHRSDIEKTLKGLPKAKDSAFMRSVKLRKHGVIFLVLAKTGTPRGKRYPAHFVFKKILTESGVIIYLKLCRVDGHQERVDALDFANSLRPTELPDPGWDGANHALPFAQACSLRTWTKPQLQMLRENAATMSAKKLAEIVGHTTMAVTKKRRQLGLPAPKKEKRKGGDWTDEQEQILREKVNDKTGTLEGFAEMFDRTQDDIRRKMTRMGLTFEKAPKSGETFDDEEEAFFLENVDKILDGEMSIQDLANLMGRNRQNVSYRVAKLRKADPSRAISSDKGDKDAIFHENVDKVLEGKMTMTGLAKLMNVTKGQVSRRFKKLREAAASTSS